MEDEALVLVAHEEDRGHLDAGLLKEFEVVDHLDEHLGALEGFVEGLVELVLAQQPEEEVAGVEVAIALARVVKNRPAREEEENPLLVAALDRPLVRRRSQRREERHALLFRHLSLPCHKKRTFLYALLSWP